MNERSPAVVGCERLRFFFAKQFDVAPQRHGGDQVFGFSNLAPHQLGAEAKRKLQDFDAHPAGREEMAELMERHKDSQDDKKPPGFLHQKPKGIGGPGKRG